MNQFLTWSDLVQPVPRSKSFTIVPNFEERILEVRTPAAALNTATIPSGPGSSFLWSEGFIDKYVTVKNLPKYLEGKFLSFDQALQTELAAVTLPSKNPDIISSHLYRWFRRKKYVDKIGEALFQKFLDKAYDPTFLTHTLMQIPFVKGFDAHGLYPLRFPDLQSGLYFIREHAPGDPIGEIVYVGMSCRRLKKTLQDHFRTWNGKYFSGYEDRAENRGDYFNKVTDGYHYEVGYLRILEPWLGRYLPLFKSQIRDLESLFIHFLLPRDNENKKPEHADSSAPELSFTTDIITPHDTDPKDEPPF